MIISRSPRWRLYTAGAIAVAAAALVGACNLDRPTPISGPTKATAEEARALPAFAYEVAVLEAKPELLERGEVARTMQRLYPEALRGTSGNAVVQFVITAEGTVDPASVKVIQVTHPEFREASVKVAETFRFKPGRYKGEAVRVLIQMPITWQPKG